MLICEFDYCVYNFKKKCILKAISISPAGLCNECLVSDINDRLLNKYKKDALSKLNFTRKLNKKND